MRSRIISTVPLSTVTRRAQVVREDGVQTAALLSRAPQLALRRLERGTHLLKRIPQARELAAGHLGRHEVKVLARHAVGRRSQNTVSGPPKRLR